jgi:hypothetical protein
MIIKHIEWLTDSATIQHIEENMFMQYCPGYSSFTNEAPFTAPIFCGHPQTHEPGTKIKNK